MSTDREELTERLVSSEEVREALGWQSADAARTWLRRQGISALSGYPADEVTDAITSRPGKGNWKPKSDRGSEAKKNKHENDHNH